MGLRRRLHNRYRRESVRMLLTGTGGMYGSLLTINLGSGIVKGLAGREAMDRGPAEPVAYQDGGASRL
jgi:hypothetical protein